MMEYITLFFTALVELSNAMAPYILFGLLFAGILHELVPDTLVTKHLGKENIGSVVKATLFGVPLPVCSCGVIPLATSIKKSGASKGATLSFLISTPITGVDSMLPTPPPMSKAACGAPHKLGNRGPIGPSVPPLSRSGGLAVKRDDAVSGDGELHLMGGDRQIRLPREARAVRRQVGL